MFHAAACCVFSTHRHPASTIECSAHPVSVPIRHDGDRSSVVTSFETGTCIHREYNKIPGTYAVYTHACGVWVVFLEYGCGALGIFKSPAFTYNQSCPPFRFTLFFLPEQPQRAAYAARGAKRLAYSYQNLQSVSYACSQGCAR